MQEEGPSPGTDCWPLDLDVQPPKWWENTVLLLKPSSLWHLSWQPKQTKTARKMMVRIRQEGNSPGEEEREALHVSFSLRVLPDCISAFCRRPWAASQAEVGLAPETSGKTSAWRLSPCPLAVSPSAPAPGPAGTWLCVPRLV